MIGFNKGLVLEKIRGGLRKLWRVKNTVKYYSGYTGEHYKLRAGFVTNLASTPFFMWWIIPPFGKYAWECALHDYLYSGDVYITRKDADIVFLEALTHGKTTHWQSMMLYRSVRYFGWLYYRETPDSIQLITYVKWALKALALAGVASAGYYYDIASILM